jgi:hypothetical protein
VWDLTLKEPGDEAMVEFFRQYRPDINWRKGEETQALATLCLLRGEGEVQLNGGESYGLEAPPEKAFLAWSNFTRINGPLKLERIPPYWEKDPPGNKLANQMTVALKELAKRASSGKGPVTVSVLEGLEKDNFADRVLAIYCLTALDDVGKLIDILGDEDPTHYLDRDTAVFCLRRWVERDASQGKKLYDEKGRTGLLVDKRYRPTEAQTVLDLLHDFREEDHRKPETFEALAQVLESRRVALAELGWWHLNRLAAGVKLPTFNAAGPLEDRRKVADAVRKTIEDGKLPPRSEP